MRLRTCTSFVVTRQICLSVLLLVIACGSGQAHDRIPGEIRVEITSGDWQLIGDLQVPAAPGLVPAVLMLNQAAGTRAAYADLAAELGKRGIATLRLDLRGHGESTNLGRFVPGQQGRSSMVWDAEADVIAAQQYLAARDGIDPAKVAIVGASYSGEEMAEAGRMHAYAAAYVALSPGSFSDESVRGIDISHVPWLFVTSRDERFLQEIRAAVQEQSRTVEQIILPGSGHAANLLAMHPGLAERIAVWLQASLTRTR